MYGYIYKTTCLITKLIYVGKHKATKFEPERYIGSGALFRKKVKEFGKANFICELIATADTKEELAELERFWIKKLNARDPAIGYNILERSDFATTGFKKMIKDDQVQFVAEDEIDNYLALGWTISFIDTKDYYQKHRQQIIRRVTERQNKLKPEIKLYKQQWEEKNADKVKKYRKRYRKANSQKLKALKDKWNEEHAEHLRQLKHEWYIAHKDANKEKKLQYQREYRAKKRSSN